jgi:hypothetical protein
LEDFSMTTPMSTAPLPSKSPGMTDTMRPLTMEHSYVGSRLCSLFLAIFLPIFRQKWAVFLGPMLSYFFLHKYSVILSKIVKDVNTFDNFSG